MFSLRLTEEGISTRLLLQIPNDVLAFMMDGDRASVFGAEDVEVIWGICFFVIFAENTFLL